MADVTADNLRDVTPAAWERNDNCDATPIADACEVGDLVKLVNGEFVLNPVNSTEADGVVLIKTYADQKNPSIGLHPEIDGYTGLTPGALVYRSADNPGKVSTTVAGNPVGKCRTATCIRFFVR